MKRRDFTCAAASLLALPAAWAQSVPLTAGENYKALKTPAPTEAAAGQIEVIEFFSYGCPHCHDFDPIFHKWAAAQPKDVIVRQVHVGFSPAFEPLQRIFYALKAMDASSQENSAKVFDAILKEKKRLSQPDVLMPWIAEQGINREKFEAAYKSFGVASQIKRAGQLQDAYQVEATPAFGIAGLYYTDPGMTRGFDNMLKVAEALIEQTRKSGGAKAKAG